MMVLLNKKAREEFNETNGEVPALESLV